MLLASTLEYAIARGWKKVHFHAGSQPYKLAWKPELPPTVERRLVSARRPLVDSVLVRPSCRNSVGSIEADRRLAGGAKRRLFPRPEVAAWNKARRVAETVPRFTRGRIQLLDYDLEYVDALTLCPQWHDLFVRETFQVKLETETPRILDCGANVGLASLYFKRRYPKARITAFEADPAIAEALRGNLQPERLRGRRGRRGRGLDQ